jgi:pheromone alpha factor receptor
MRSDPFFFSNAQKVYLNQYFNLTDIYGEDIPVNFQDLQAWSYALDVQSLAYGLAIGLSGIVFFVSIALALEDRAKFRRPIFLLNLSSLFLVICQGFFSVILLVGPYIGTAQILLGAPSPHGLTIVSLRIVINIVQLCLYGCILGTLILQVRVVFSAARSVQRYLTVFLTAAALVTFALQMALLVIYTRTLFTDVQAPYWLASAALGSFTGFIGLCSIIFLYKLAVTIRQRRKMGVKKFGPLQILFIMSCQCLVLPRMNPTFIL